MSLWPGSTGILAQRPFYGDPIIGRWGPALAFFSTHSCTAYFLVYGDLGIAPEKALFATAEDLR
jgi:hypothetical protein